MNSRREVLENAGLLVENDRVAKVSPGGSSDVRDTDEVIDCRGKIIIPGLVSAHSHLTGMFQRGLWDEASFESWSSRSTATENLFNPSAEDIRTIHSAACTELIRHGVTTVLNMFTPSPNRLLENVNSACQGLLDTGIRGILALSLKDQSPDNNAIAIEPMAPGSWGPLAREAAELVRHLNSRVTFMLAPSAPQRCSDRLLVSCRELAEELKVGIHTHLAETKRHAEVGQRLYGEAIVKHLEKIGFLNSSLSMAHSIWLEDEEIALLKKYDVKVVHNPASNMKLGSGVARVKKMLNQGLAVGLGADSVNAGTIYSVFEQMKLSVLLPRALWEAESWILPQEAFEMGNLGGARAVLLDGFIGSIEEGKKADLVILNPSVSLLPMNALIDQLVLCENGESVESVFVDGKPVMLNKRLTTVDEEAILAKLASLRPRIARAKAAVLAGH
ncbi:MAG: amidohydrolase family protein [Candidatus Binatia bacterium]